MTSRCRQSVLLTSLGMLLLAAGAALAQMPRPSVNAVPQSPGATVNEPSFRDPKTGQVWTPDNVGEDGKPVAPSDRAFNPAGQAVVDRGVMEQTVKAKRVGSVAITAGPTVPLVEIDNPTLGEMPGGRWRVVLYLNNNSPSTLSPVIGCTFTNAGQPVQTTRALLDPVAGGERVGMTVFGPRSQAFVDSVHCNVASP